nr:DinB family protein [Deinobacterium chartae]
MDRLLGHDAWTTSRLLDQSETLSDAQLDQRFDLGWGSVRATFEHIIDNMETWTDLMNGRVPRELPGPPQHWRTLAGLRARLDAVAPELAELARRVQREGRQDELWTDVLDDPPTQKTYGGAIVHVITHSMHHRSQLIHMLKQLGVENVLEGDVLSWENAGREGLRAIPGRCPRGEGVLSGDCTG